MTSAPPFIFFSGQRLRDLHLQRRHARQQHGSRQHQPEAFWEEANLSGSPPGLEGVLSQPAATRVSFNRRLSLFHPFGVIITEAQLTWPSRICVFPADRIRQLT